MLHQESQNPATPASGLLAFPQPLRALSHPANDGRQSLSLLALSVALAAGKKMWKVIETAQVGPKQIELNAQKEELFEGIKSWRGRVLASISSPPKLANDL